MVDPNFYIQASELSLRFQYPARKQLLSFKHSEQDFEEWRTACKVKLAELLGLEPLQPAIVQPLRTTQVGDVELQALIMHMSSHLTLPAYLLVPSAQRKKERVILAIHGHGEVEPCLGSVDDYHHGFALALAQQGYVVLCPELRGFGLLRDLARDLDGHRLDYWQWGQHMAYSLVTDALQKGRTLIGDTIADLLCWESWLIESQRATTVDVIGISYGGDLALTYPVFSEGVNRIFASGTLGSFEPIFARGYNAPAHCIPGILQWMDRADIAGLNAPRPLALHYGSLDVPGPDNFSASYNESVAPALDELRAIYRAAGAEEQVKLVVSEGKGHEMDLEAAASFLTE
jgi:cephalosporin-C deacetylase-like acetyl esterase